MKVVRNYQAVTTFLTGLGGTEVKLCAEISPHSPRLGSVNVHWASKLQTCFLLKAPVVFAAHRVVAYHRLAFWF